MRVWIHGSGRSPAFGPGAAFSAVVHAALLGGALLGNARAEDVATPEVGEQVYYLLPRDRMPALPPLARLASASEAGGGAPAEARPAADAPPRGEGTGAAEGDDSQQGADETSQPIPTTPDAIPDSVYLLLGVEQGATRVDGSAAPAYPAAMVERRVEGLVTARYVVDSTGVPDITTLQVLVATHPEFVVSVREALPQMRFTPGTIRGRPIRQMVEQRFQFSLIAHLPAEAGHPGTTRTQ